MHLSGVILTTKKCVLKKGQTLNVPKQGVKVNQDKDNLTQAHVADD